MAAVVVLLARVKSRQITKPYSARCWWRGCSAAIISHHATRNTLKGANGIVVAILVPPVYLYMPYICVKQVEPKQLRGRNALLVRWLHIAFVCWDPVSPLLNIHD